MVTTYKWHAKDSSFCVFKTDTKYSKKRYNSHFQVHRQDLSCSPYAQPLKQAQENFQTYTIKGDLSHLIFNNRIILNILL